MFQCDWVKVVVLSGAIFLALTLEGAAKDTAPGGQAHMGEVLTWTGDTGGKAQP